MAEDKCNCEWKMINVRSGYLVTEGCAQTGARRSFFSTEQNPPVDNYVEGEWTWKYMGSSQAIKFDLECTECGRVVNLDSTVGLMLCTNCSDNCNAGAMRELLGGDGAWIYVALCSDTSHTKGKCVDLEATRALTEYFNSRIKSPGKNIFFVPCSFIPNIDVCQGEVIADIGLTEIY
jgi:hypothetical protein